MALPPIYDPEACRPMQEELHRVGVKSLTTPEEVEAFINSPGTALVVVNSVCGCAAGGARPGVMLALQNKVIPNRLGTVFAGVHRDAVESARSHMPDVVPSSPCIAMFKDGKPIFVLERHQIEQMAAQEIAANLAKQFSVMCNANGPSIPENEFAKINPIQQCGSSIPLL